MLKLILYIAGYDDAVMHIRPPELDVYCVGTHLRIPHTGNDVSCTCIYCSSGISDTMASVPQRPHELLLRSCPSHRVLPMCTTAWP